MLELAIKGNKKYWGWLSFLALIISIGMYCFVWQLDEGLGITGLSRDVSWGFYVAQLTFMVGVAASAVMLVLPYYLHNYKEFGKITIIGEFVAVSAICICMMFLFVDLGQPMRAMNVMLNPTPGSVIFWDANVLVAYLLVNIVVGWNVLEAERNGVAPKKWLKPFIYISIPLAFGIHTTTAFLYCGLPGRGFWLTAILAPRFLASAFAAGPAFLILLCIFLKKITDFDAGEKSIQTLATIVTYGLLINLFFFMCEVFVAFYSGIPEHTVHLKYLYAGIHGHGKLVPWMWLSIVLMVLALVLLMIPKVRQNKTVLIFSCVCVFAGIWIDKGIGLMTAGFVPSPLHKITEYTPTWPELTVSLGVYGVGILILTILLKIVISVKREVA